MAPPSTHSLLEEPLKDLLLALEARGESAELRVQTQSGPALISVNQGRLGAAAFGPKVGPDALKHLLSFKDGTYTIAPSAPVTSGSSEEIRTWPELGRIIREKERKSTRSGASSSRPLMRIRGVLSRTAQPLPSGLSPVELRALAAVDGRSSILNMVSTLRDPVAESLRAFRKLIQIGLVSEGSTVTYSATLSMGTNLVGTHLMGSKAAGANQPVERMEASAVGSFAPLPSRRITLVAGEERPAEAHGSNDRQTSDSERVRFGAEEMDPVGSDEVGLGPSGADLLDLDSADFDPEMQQLKRKATGRWAKAPEKRASLNSTGYSSVPPPALATDQVSLPRSLRERPDEGVSGGTAQKESSGESFVSQRSSSAAERRALGSLKGGHTESSDDEDEHPSAPPVPLIRPRRLHQEPARHDTPTALSSATVRSERTFPEQKYELRESEIPVPSTRLDSVTLEQLDELDAAVRSSRRPNLPDFRPPSSKGKPPSEPGPPSSLGFGIPLGELPSPGSVPYPQELPGDTAEDSTSGLPRVGRYEVLARLKRGGMGSIYMCRLSGTAGFRRLFAMKVLHGHLAAQSESLEAFFHEARVLGELHHPNIVGIADVGTPQEPYIVMDYVEGGSLAELFRATASGRDPALTITVVLDALNGLSYAHSALDDNGESLDLVHHDVTPHNLLVGIDGSCRVTDFGIARTRKEAGDPAFIQGKPAYLAPERLRREPADHRADVFSMGVVLYLGLTGVEPFRGATPEETTQLILQGRVNVPSEVGFRPPKALDWICLTALAREPEARFSSAHEMALQLRRVAERSGLVVPTADVASWVRASLGPTLAARRAASMRGTGATEPPPQVASVTPKEPPRVPSDAPSAAETTGPLEPPNSRAFDDNTEILTNNEPASGAEGERLDPRRRYIVFAALILAGAVAIWAVSDPHRAGKLFTSTDPLSSSPTEPAPPHAKAANDTPTAEKKSPPRSSKAGKKIEIDDEGHVVLPPIQPSGDQ